mgnify:FL=1
MRQVDKKYTFWLAGYYDDFMGATTLADDSNTPGGFWLTSSTHHGNPFTGLAPLNPRYKYAWVERGNGASGRFNNAVVSSDIQHTFNKGISEWASFDENRDFAGKWNGLAQLSYPDSLMNANRQRYDTGLGLLGQAYKTSVTDNDYAPIEGYMLFCNGYNTQGKYYAGIGINDGSFGRAKIGINSRQLNAAPLNSKAGFPLDGSNNPLSTPAYTIRTHLAGFYTGEVSDTNDIDNNPEEWMKEIKSPSGKPFLIQEVFDSGTTYRPTLVYDGSLNSKSDLDVFTIRICPLAVDNADARVKLIIGCEGTPWSSTNTTDSTYANFAVEYEITPSAYPVAPTSSISWDDLSAYDMWDDYDFIFNYTAGVYDIVKNGVTVSTGNAIGNKADGTKFTAADMYGWAISVKAHGAKASVLVDRAGLIMPLNDHPSPSISDMPPALDFSYSASVNTASKVDLSIIDDDTQLKLMSLFNGSAYADWSLLMFRNSIDRPIWRGMVDSMSYHNQSSSRTPTIKLTASDFFSEIDNQMPVWEFGQNGEGDATEQVAYDRSEAQNELNMYNFGTSILTSANQGLGFNEVEDGSGVFKNHLDSRMRNRSAHPIQMYLGEDDVGPNDAYDDWDDAITAGHATADAAHRSIHSRWIKDISKSVWFKFLFSKIKSKPISVTELNSRYKINRCEINSDFDIGDTTMSLNSYFPDFDTQGEGVIEFVDDDGFVDAGVYDGISTSTVIGSSCLLRVHQCRIMDGGAKNASGYGTPGPTSPSFGIPGNSVTFYQMQFYVPKSASANYQDLLVTSLNGEGLVGISGGSLPSYFTSGRWALINNEHIGATRTKNAQEETISGVDYWVYRLVKYRSGGFISSYETFWKSPAELGETTFPWGSTPVTQTTRPTLIETPYANYHQLFNNPSYANVPTDYAIQEHYGNVTLKGGNTVLTIPKTNFFQRNHASGSKFRLRDLDTEDYKHIWILWADMRNDGNADADGGFRKNKFGLMTPYSGNYQISLGIADDAISTVNERSTFTDLNIGEEVDLWEIDSEVDPITGVAWSAVSGGSNSESNSKYHNWQDKAGSFIIVDTSKFFNLNTASNGGRTFQSSGGRKEVGDYLVETEGFPVMIDNYWTKAPATYRNLDDEASWNANFWYFINDTTVLTTSLKVDDRVIQLDNPAVLQTTDLHVGQIISESQKTIFHYAAYASAANQAVYQTTGRTGVSAVANGAGRVTLSESSGGAASIGALYRAGHIIEISGSTTTPSIDGVYRISSQDPVSLATPYAQTTTLDIVLDNPATTIGSGTCTVKAPGTLGLRNAVNLGVPVPATTIDGQWDGTGYGATPPSTSITASTANRYDAWFLTYFGGRGTIPAHDNKSHIDIEIDPDSENNYSDAIVYGGLANIFPMRLIMSLNGFIENKASGTWYDSDKFRCAYSDILAETWLKQAKAYGIPSIATIPVSKNMTTTQKDALTFSGLITGITAPSGGSSVFTSNKPHNLVVGDIVTVIDCDELGLMGKTKDFTVTAKTSSTFTALNSTTPTGSSGIFGRWREAQTVDDFGGVNDCRNSTLGAIYSSTQGLAGTSDKYAQRQMFCWVMGRDGRPSFRPTYSIGTEFNTANLKLSSIKTQGVKQFTNVRVFYGGAGLFVDFPTPSLNSTPKWNIISMPQVGTSAEALAIAKAEFEKTKAAPMQVNAEILRFEDNTSGNNMYGDKTVMLEGARFGYVADGSQTIPRSKGNTYTNDKGWAWASLWGGNPFPGMVSALDVKGSGLAPKTAGFLGGGSDDYDEGYYWYGSRSLSYAVQVVHIPRNMPKTTQNPQSGANNASGTGYVMDGNLRMVIEVGDGDTIEEYSANAINPCFTIKLIDYLWKGNPDLTGRPPHSAVSSTKVVVDANGFYEIDIPPSYWGDRTGLERIILSVNYEYLLAVAKNRCGTNNLRNRCNYVGDSGYSLLQSESLFPLGMGSFTPQEASASGAQPSYFNTRAEWYAPRLHICDDINFVPATQIAYTDPSLSMTQEPMFIKSVKWSQNARQTEVVSFTLERDVNRNVQHFAALFLPPNAGNGGKTFPTGGSMKPGEQGAQGYNNDKYGGNPANGGFGRVAGVASINSGTTAGSRYDPVTNGAFKVDGTALNDSSAFALGSNILNSNFTKRIKGSMDFNNDSVTGGGFGVLGQKKPSAAPTNDDPESGTDTFTTTSSGDASTSTTGVSFAGATDATGAYNESTTTLRVPSNPRGRKVTVSSLYSLPCPTGQVASLDVTVSCRETGHAVTKTVTLAEGNNVQAILFAEPIIGANNTGNTISVSFGRDAGNSPDTAQYTALTLHTIQISFDTQSVSGSSQSGSMTYGR